jgi:hypothetical protein
VYRWQHMLHQARCNGSRINTTFRWEDDDKIGTSHNVLLFGDQHETFRTTVMVSDWSLVHDQDYVSQCCSRVSVCACKILKQPVPVPSLSCHCACDRARSCARAILIVPLCLWLCPCHSAGAIILVPIVTVELCLYHCACSIFLVIMPVPLCP